MARGWTDSLTGLAVDADCWLGPWLGKCRPEHLPLAFLGGLGFLTPWWLGSQGVSRQRAREKLYCLFLPTLGSYTVTSAASYSSRQSQSPARLQGRRNKLSLLIESGRVHEEQEGMEIWLGPFLEMKSVILSHLTDGETEAPPFFPGE